MYLDALNGQLKRNTTVPRNRWKKDAWIFLSHIFPAQLEGVYCFNHKVAGLPILMGLVCIREVYMFIDFNPIWVPGGVGGFRFWLLLHFAPFITYLHMY